MDSRTNGRFKRDWVYVEDVVQAYIGVGEALLNDEIEVSDAYNFSSTEYLSVMDVYKKIISKFSESYIEPIIKEDSDYEIKDQYLSSEKIKKELGINSTYNMDSALSETIEWYQSFLKEL